jgi:hypothetical protein
VRLKGERAAIGIADVRSPNTPKPQSAQGEPFRPAREFDATGEARGFRRVAAVCIALAGAIP